MARWGSLAPKYRSKNWILWFIIKLQVNVNNNNTHLLTLCSIHAGYYIPHIRFSDHNLRRWCTRFKTSTRLLYIYPRDAEDPEPLLSMPSLCQVLWLIQLLLRPYSSLHFYRFQLRSRWKKNERKKNERKSLFRKKLNGQVAGGGCLSALIDEVEKCHYYGGPFSR